MCQAPSRQLANCAEALNGGRNDLDRPIRSRSAAAAALAQIVRMVDADFWAESMRLAARLAHSSSILADQHR